MFGADPPPGDADLHGPQIIAALRAAGWATSDKLIAWRAGYLELPAVCIVKLKWGQRGERSSGHWVVKDHDVVRDPLPDGPLHAPWENRIESTGYIEITGRNHG
jgi:hypothetical protein